jgi:hypothetical protein
MAVLLPQPSVRALIRSKGTAFSVTSSAALKGVIVVLIVTTVGAALALQGWRSRIPDFDLLLSTNGAIELVANKQIPDRGALASFASHNPPGGAWLMAPGVLLFKDPRLFEFIVSATLYTADTNL